MTLTDFKTPLISTLTLSFLLMIVNKITMLFYGVGSYDINKLTIVLCVLVSFSYIVIEFAGMKITKETFLMFAFSLFLFLVVLLQLSFFSNHVDSFGRSSYSYLVSNTVYGVFYIFVGYMFIKNDGNKSNIKALLLLLPIFFIVLDVSGGKGFISYYQFSKNLSLDEGLTANHLLLGPYLYFLFVYIYSLSKGYLRGVIFLSVLYLLFVLGGRGDLILFVLTVLTFELIRDFKVKNVIVSAVLFVFLLFVYIMLPYFIEGNYFIERMLVQDGVHSDGSFVARIELLISALHALPNQFMVGDIGYLIRSNNSLGSYIHNFLSIIQFYGLLVFLLVISVLFFGVKNVIYLKSNNCFSSMKMRYDFYVLMLITTFYGLLLFKSAVYILLWFTIGCIFGVGVKLSGLKVQNGL